MAEFSWQVPEVRVGQDDCDGPMDVEEHHIELEQLEQQRQLQLQLQDDTPTLVEQPAVLCYDASDDETTPPGNGSSQPHQQLLPPLDCCDVSISTTNGPDSASGCSSSSIYRGSLPREGALPLSLSPASSLLAVPGQAAGNSRRRHSWICR